MMTPARDRRPRARTTDRMWIDLALPVAAYLLGSVSSAILVCRLARLPDPRGLGSRNPGATNVLRTGSKAAAAATLAGDMVKGLVPVAAGHALGLSPVTLVVAGGAAFLGHLYPVFFGFQGGKGVATALGVALGLSWPTGAAAAGTWLLIAALTRYSSLAALVAIGLTPLYLWALGAPPSWIAGMAALALVLIARHYTNIRRLIAGTEPRIGKAGPRS